MNMHNPPALLARLSDTVDEYDAKVAALPDVVKAFHAAVSTAEMAATIGGRYIGSVWSHGAPRLDEATMRRNLLESAWRHVYSGLNLDRIAPASDRSRFDTALKSPAPFTLDNIRATFGHYLVDPRSHVLRGLAEAFSQLDPAFKSHDRMKVGVKGLPKRVILSNVTPSGYGGWGTARLTDMLNALAVFCGQPQIEHVQLSGMLEAAKAGEGRLREILPDAEGPHLGYREKKLGETVSGIMGDDVWLKRFANGNGHLFFGPAMLAAVNQALAEYYGEVLPDCPEATPKRAASTAVVKDLQFYPTPDAAADQLLERAYPSSGDRVLEPSCGDGALLEALRRHCVRRNLSDVRSIGIEVDPGRAAACQSKGWSVQRANFLQVTPSPSFDLVIMNPPFYGKHYQKHVEHGLKFLKPGGRLYAILPITAVTDHGFVDPGRGWDRWKDLPVGSFSPSGTNINTGIATFAAE